MNRSLAEQFQARLHDDEEKQVSAALLALGHLEDDRVVPLLIDLLVDPRPGVHRNAHWALIELTGQRLPPEIALWKRWYTEQLRWHEREEEAALATLRDRESAAIGVLDALRAVTVHRLHRHEMALFVAPRLHDPNEFLRQTACEVLEDLDSRWAVSDLIQCLDDPSEELRQAASQALTSITGERRPAESAAWADYPAPVPSNYF